jgi:FkbM family methyltransferase
MKRLLHTVINAIGYEVISVQHLHNELMQHLLHVFERNKIDCIIDVGANAGQYGMSLRKAGYDGYIMSFEPVRAAYKKLEEKAKRDRKWLCYMAALGDEKGLKRINVYKSTVFSSFLQANAYSKEIWRSLDDVGVEEVNVIRLDDILSELIRRSRCSRLFLKMDTQGYDDHVFRGALQSLNSIRGLQSEVAFIPVYEGMTLAYDVLSQFHKHGFYISGMYPVNRENSSLAVIEYDCVLVKRD